MIFIESNCKDAAYHFSVEELFTRIIKPSEPVLMIWQTDKTVMLGNNQIVNAEVNLDFASNENIKIVRRSSGGGAIYTDSGTVLYTTIQPLNKDAKYYREETAANIIGVLETMGAPAYREGRNDILLDGKKISGFAQYISGSHICTHGSLLYDTDIEALTRVLIPSIEKLQPKGIASIRSRVTNIRPYIDNDYSIEEFIVALKNNLLIDNQYREYKFSDEEMAKAENIRGTKYSNPEWNMSY
ncbi:MAG: lipoate--protein ligase family protein [Oscillospiraceae bacterium]|nr:lipoate--protein ligase family protein [Oscillospiraceae bacterium]